MTTTTAAAVLPAATANVRPKRREPLAQRIAAALTGSPWFWLALVLFGFTLPIVRTLNRQLPAPPPVLGAFPAFALTDEGGHAVTPERFRGRIVIAEFVSPEGIEGGGVTPMANLQKRVRNTADAVHLLSFVRPRVTGEAPDLARLSRAVHAGPWRWTLAGGDVASLEEKARPLAGGVLDGKLLLVDARGRVRRLLPATPGNVDLMMRDIGLLVNLEGK